MPAILKTTQIIEPSSAVTNITLDADGNAGFGGSAVTLPVGTTAQRPSTAANGMMRWNSTLPALEFYNGTNWTLGNTGNVIQVVQKVFTDVTSSTTAYTYVNITNGNQSITSKVANSKFLVMYYVQGYVNGTSGMNIGLNRTISASTTRLLGTDGTSGDAWMGSGNGAGTNSYCVSKQYLDSPAQAVGTVITYQLLLGLWSTGTVYAGYSGYSPQSSITILEIAP